jgi:CheY-like chemotaxis protein
MMSMSRASDDPQWPSPRLRGVRVLVVEDDGDEREFTATLLAAAGADVHTAGDARQALAMLAWWWPDVLVSDIGLPDGDGCAMLEVVRATPRGRRLPAAAVTGQAKAEDRRRALRAGYRAHLAKPVDPDRLVTVVADLAAPAALEPAG